MEYNWGGARSRGSFSLLSCGSSVVEEGAVSEHAEGERWNIAGYREMLLSFMCYYGDSVHILQGRDRGESLC
jgi:hypothetical protein